MQILRYTAFTDDPCGGNQAGVVLDAAGASDEEMQAVATELGYSETAFMVTRTDGDMDIRYFSPLAEVPFCGHATVAAAVAHAGENGPGPLRLHTRAGLVEVATTETRPDVFSATLVSVAPRVRDLPDPGPLLAALRWSAADLDPGLPVRVAYAGAWHPIVGVRTRERLADLAYDFGALGELMASEEWTTVQLVYRENDVVFHSRNPFPPGGVVEDAATGAAAAALGGYLRELGLISLPGALTIRQGEDMGRPSVLTVAIPSDPASGIHVTGSAVRI
nr:PhzF family phenazine biosynthesis protein [Actinokineospora enzanensis]